MDKDFYIDFGPVAKLNSNISVDKLFEWSVFSCISVSQSFEWHVGEGPLFWYRIEWGEPVPNVCNNYIVTYSDLDRIQVAKGDIIPYRTIVGYKKDSDPLEPVYYDENIRCDAVVTMVDIGTGVVWIEMGDCPSVISYSRDCITPAVACDCAAYTEVWHMLATSVPHLCQRIFQECQGWYGVQSDNPMPVSGERVAFIPGNKIIKKLEKFDRPAFCCDVGRWAEYEKINTIYNRYVAIPYSELCICDCARFIDPCRCGGINHGESVVPPIEFSGSNTPLFGILKPPTSSGRGFNVSNLKVLDRKKQDVLTKCCGSVPANLLIIHNLAETNILREFLSRNHISLPKSFEILYRENTNTWQRSFHYDTSSENWLIVFEWSCCDDYDPGNYSWKYHLHVRKQRGAVIQNTRVMINFASHGMLDKDEMFSVSFNVNASTKRVTSRQPIIVKYKIMTDEIGLFRKDPYLVTTISVLEKG